MRPEGGFAGVPDVFVLEVRQPQACMMEMMSCFTARKHSVCVCLCCVGAGVKPSSVCSFNCSFPTVFETRYDVIITLGVLQVTWADPSSLALVSEEAQKRHGPEGIT